MSEQFRSITSASNVFRRVMCPGSETAEEGLPEIQSNPSARNEGVLLHKIEQDDEQEESAEDLNAAQVRALAKNKRLTDEHVARTFARLNITDPGPCKIFKEREFFLIDRNQDPVFPPFPGHTDEVRWYPKVKICFVYDSKFGRYPVASAEVNYQLRVYVINIHDDIGPERTLAAIRQPYLPPPMDFHDVEYEAKDVEEWRAEILDALAACKKPDAERRPNFTACHYCRARGTVRCPESISIASDISRIQILELEPHKLEKLGGMIAMAASVVDGWKDRMQLIAQKYPALLKMYELGEQQYSHILNNPSIAFKKMLEEGSVYANGNLDTRLKSLEDFLTDCCKPSVPKLRKAVSKRKKINEKDAQEFLFNTLGRTFEGEDNEHGALITSKPKQRSLKAKQ